MSDSIIDAASHLQSLLQSKEKGLKEREADFSRRVKVFEQANPSMGNDNDVIQLNVGGSTNIAVLRQTLTQFEGSMLAAKFSGRWDDSLEKDSDGKIFVDQDPEIFIRLINFLRLRQNRRLKVPVRSPDPSYEFCCMLDYYDLMPGVYPQQWIGRKDLFSCEEESYGAWVLSSKESGAGADTAPAHVLHDFGRFSKAGISEFTVEFDKGTKGAVGWLRCDRETAVGWPGDQALENDSPFLTLNKNISNSVFLSITERKIFGPSEILEENMRIDNDVSPTKIICRHDGNGRYSIEAVGISPPGGVPTTNVQDKYRGVYVVFPMISFSGKVTVSGLKYAIDTL